MPYGRTVELRFIFLQGINFFNNFLGNLQVVGISGFKNFHDHGIFLRQQAEQNEIRRQRILVQVDHFHGAYIEGFDHLVCKIADMLLKHILVLRFKG